MGLFQRLKQAYRDGKMEAELEESLLPTLQSLREDQREAFSETYERAREALTEEIIPEEGSLERDVYYIGRGIGRMWYDFKSVC